MEALTEEFAGRYCPAVVPFQDHCWTVLGAQHCPAVILERDYCWTVVVRDFAFSVSLVGLQKLKPGARLDSAGRPALYRNRGPFFPAREKRRASRVSRACRAGNREINVENREINVKNREINVKNREINVKNRSRETARPDPRARRLDRPGRPRPSRRGLNSRFWHLPRAGQAREMRDALCFGRAERNLPRFFTLISRFFHVNFAIFHVKLIIGFLGNGNGRVGSSRTSGHKVCRSLQMSKLKIHFLSRILNL